MLRLSSALAAARVQWSADQVHDANLTMRLRLDNEGKDDAYFQTLVLFRENQPVRREIREERQRLLRDMGNMPITAPLYDRHQIFLQGRIAALNWALQIIHTIKSPSSKNEEHHGKGRNGKRRENRRT